MNTTQEFIVIGILAIMLWTSILMVNHYCHKISLMYATILELSSYFHRNALNFQYEKMGDYVRKLEMFLPENEK